MMTLYPSLASGMASILIPLASLHESLRVIARQAVGSFIADFYCPCDYQLRIIPLRL